MKAFFLCVLFELFTISNFDVSVTLEKVSDGLISPVAMAVANDGSNNLYICEQHGVIRLVKSGALLSEPFLDIRDKIIPQINVYSERGLLGIAFHPGYKKNRKFYVYYSAKSKKKGSNHKSIVAEYLASASNPDKADKLHERVLLEIEQPESNHNGGQLAFGPDGYLYIGIGDGGGAGDKHGKFGNSQNLNTLLGKILRIDVNTSSGYKIPHDNPFLGKVGLDEIWAYGLRNPWKFSFDRMNGRLFCADVGQDKWEEVNIIKKGANYGWRVMEGNHCFNPEYNCNIADLEMPIAEYSHEEGKSVTGGYVYWGKLKSWNGKYIFADWTGKLFVLTEQSNHTWIRNEIKVNFESKRLFINSLGEDERGEIYVLCLSGIGPEKSGGALFRLNLN